MNHHLNTRRKPRKYITLLLIILALAACSSICLTKPLSVEAENGWGHYPGAEWKDFRVGKSEFRDDNYLVRVSSWAGHQKRASRESNSSGDGLDFFMLNLYDDSNEINGPLFCIMPLTCFQQTAISAPHCYYSPEDLLQEQYDYDAAECPQVAEKVRQSLYFGYGCLPIEKHSIGTYFATQMYLWEQLDFKVTGGQLFGRQGDLSWYEKYKEDIARRRYNYFASDPSIDGQIFELEPGQDKIITDDNQVLESIMLSAGFTPNIAHSFEGDRGFVEITWLYPNSLKLVASEDFANSLEVTINSGGESTAFCLDNGVEQAVITSEYHLEPRSFSFTLNSTAQYQALTPTADFKLQKLAPRIVSWESQGTCEGREIFKAIYAEKGLPEVSFKLTLAEEVLTEQGKLSAGELSYEFETDGEGKAYLADLPCADYVLQELKVPEGYLLDPTPLNLTIVEDEESLADPQPYVVRNDRIPFSLKAIKLLQNKSEIDSGDMETNIAEMRFALELAEDFANGYTSLPAGSLVDLSGLTVIAEPSLLMGVEENADNIWTSLELSPPFPGQYRLLELNPGAYHEPMEPLELDLSSLSMTTPQEDGSHQIRLNRPLFNRLRTDSVTSVPPTSPTEPEPTSPSEEAETKPSSPPSQYPPITINIDPPSDYIKFDPVIQNSAAPVKVELQNITPAAPPSQSPPVQVDSYVEGGPDHTNLARQLPRTGSAHASPLSLLTLAWGILLRGLRLKRL